MIKYVVVARKDIDDSQLNYITKIFNKDNRLYVPTESYLIFHIIKLNYFTIMSPADSKIAVNLNKDKFDWFFKLLIIDKQLAINYINTLGGS